MFNIKLPASVGCVCKRIGAVLYDNAPKILLTTGSGLIIFGGIKACKVSALHASDTKITLDALESINSYYEEVQASGDYDRYPKKDKIKDELAILMNHYGGITKDMLVPVGLVGTGFACIFAGFNVLDKRYIAMAGMYDALVRTIEANSKENDPRFPYNNDNFEEKTGENVSDSDEITVNPDDIYTFWFRKGNPHWDDDNNFNILFLINAQRTLNNRLHIEKGLFRSEIVKTLGGSVESGDIKYPRDNMVGLAIGNGDNYVDFGLFDADGQILPWVRKFMSSHDDCIPVRINCDGNILPYLSKKYEK